MRAGEQSIIWRVFGGSSYCIMRPLSPPVLHVGMLLYCVRVQAKYKLRLFPSLRRAPHQRTGVKTKAKSQPDEGCLWPRCMHRYKLVVEGPPGPEREERKRKPKCLRPPMTWGWWKVDGE